MLLCGQTNSIWSYWAGRHAANPERYPHGVGFLICPSYINRVQPKKFMPFVLDNDAFNAWKKGEEWNEKAWLDMLQYVRMTTLKPLWVAVPDVVENRSATLDRWPIYRDEVKRIGWKTAFCVQDEMTPDDVPNDADVVFVGGSDRWKFPNLRMWTDNFPRVHCARVNAPEMIEACERLGCESIDGTGWFRDPSRQDKLPAIERFIDGHRNQTPELF
jgi:hypothetical protein